MTKIKLALIFGGVSSEYNVSLVSSSAVLRNINRDKYEIYMIGINKKGDFYLYVGDIDDIENDNWCNQNCKKITFSTNRSDHGFIILDTNEIIRIDIAFPILHGQNGEDGRLQGLFELSDIPFVGCGMDSSLLCMDKYLSHELVKAKGINVAQSLVFDNNDKAYILKSIEKLKFPLFIKPLKAGSSFGITKLMDKTNLYEAIDEAFKYDSKIIIEENIEGFEVGCAILGNKNLEIGEVDEIVLKEGFFDYTEKYNLLTSEIILPARISELEKARIKNTALDIYRILNCKGLARVDMFYTNDFKIYFNEVNTIPGFTDHSRFPSMLKKVGYSFSALIDKLIELGLEK